LIEKLCEIGPFDLLHLAHKVVAERRQMSGGARRHAACNGSAVNNNDRAAELAQLISGREPRNSAADDRDVALLVSLQWGGLRRHGNRHP
jgi:hypothetical protein